MNEPKVGDVMILQMDGGYVVTQFVAIETVHGIAHRKCEIIDPDTEENTGEYVLRPIRHVH